MEIEEATSGIVHFDGSDFKDGDFGPTSFVYSELEMLERKMKMELTPE